MTAQPRPPDSSDAVARSPFDLSGRRALITGATGDIGGRLAMALADAGAQVVVHGRDASRVSAQCAALERAARPGSASPLPAVFDMTDRSGMLAEVARIVDAIGGVDILVNNAGMQLRAPLIDIDLAGWNLVLETNLTSCFVLSQAVARGMLDRGHGKIINICSVQNFAVRRTTAPYAVAKAGLAALTRSMCAEWAIGGIQANGLAPGYIDTDLNRSLLDDRAFSDWVEGRTPAGRWGTTDDLAGPAVWLASSASDFVNGQIIFVDGGMTAVI